MCEEFEFHQDRSGQPAVLMGQSIVLSEIKAEVPLQNEIPSHQNVLLQQFEERLKLLSQESKVSKFCVDAGFVHVVGVGQYFMTKDTGDFTKFHTVACREYTLPRDGKGDGVAKAGQKQAAADSRGSRTCVCAITLLIIGSGTRSTYPGSARRGTGKAGENGQHSGEVGGSSAWTRPSPECGDTLKALAGDHHPI